MKTINNEICNIIALINNKFLVYSKDNIMYASLLYENKLYKIENDEDYKLIINIISKIKSLKPNLINYGFCKYNDKNLKVIYDITEEKKYYYELKEKYEEIEIQELNENNPFIFKIVDNIEVIIFNKFLSEFSTKFLETQEISIKILPGVYKKDFEAFNNGVSEQIHEEAEKVIDEDYKSINFKNERNYIKLLMEILGPKIILDTYYSSNDKILINELLKYLDETKCYNLINYLNTNEADEIIKELYNKKFNNFLENDLICMSFLDSVHNTNKAGFKIDEEILKIEVDKFYIEEELISEYAYITHYTDSEEKITILHDMNRRTNRYRKK